MFAILHCLTRRFVSRDIGLLTYWLINRVVVSVSTSRSRDGFETY